MNKQELSRVIDEAKDVCVSSGARFTDKRRNVLEVLLLSNVPLSAYEITDAYNKRADKPMPPMSVYRILGFLETENLVHKLTSMNKYLACSNISCECNHEIPQFLICSECQQTEEITISNNIIDELGKFVSQAGYRLTDSQLELQCLCNDCSTKIA